MFCAFFKGLITMRTKMKPLATQDTTRNFLVVEGNLPVPCIILNVLRLQAKLLSISMCQNNQPLEGYQTTYVQ